tara:strand:- start:114 stop:293 length:180 start_codon:yes stop_codon:yes gene_type:complete
MGKINNSVSMAKTNAVCNAKECGDKRFIEVSIGIASFLLLSHPSIAEFNAKDHVQLYFL